MEKSLERLVWERARSLCEYCRLPQEFTTRIHQIDHIIAVKHRGETVAANLALACMADNNHKGPNIAGIDPVSKKIIRLFHPRIHKWSAHFRWDGPILIGRTAIGRTTIAVLEINLPHRILLRQGLIEEGVFPPRR